MMNQTFIRAEELDSANSSFKLVWHAALKSEPLAQRRRLRSNPLETFGFSANPVNPVPHGPGSRDYRRAFLCASFAVPN